MAVGQNVKNASQSKWICYRYYKELLSVKYVRQKLEKKMVSNEVLSRFIVQLEADYL